MGSKMEGWVEKGRDRYRNEGMGREEEGRGEKRREQTRGKREGFVEREGMWW
jgi:hypothetical protein